MEATAQDVAALLAEHWPSQWRSFANDNTIYRCCGTDFGNATRKARRGDAEAAVASWAAHVAEQLAPLLAAAYERGRADGRAQVVTAVEAVHHPAPHQPAATEHPWCVGCHEGHREDRYPCATIDALAPHSAALAEHDAEVAAKALREAADRMPAFHDRDVPEWAITSACKWLRARADRIEAGS